MEKRESSYTVGGNINPYTDYRGQYGDSYKRELAYDPATPLLGIHP